MAVSIFFCFLLKPAIAQFNEQSFLQQLDSLVNLKRLPGSNHHPYFSFSQQGSENRPGVPHFSLPVISKPFSGSNCRDTSSRVSTAKDSVHFYITQPVLARDGNLLISGEYYNYWDPETQGKGFLLKSDPYGNVLWAKVYDSLHHNRYHYLNHYSLLELQDGSILMAGAAPDVPSGNDDIIFTKTDARGNLLWTRDYYSRVWQTGHGSADLFYIQQMKQDPANGDVYLISPSWAMGLYVLKMNITNGDIVWSNLYHLNTGGYGSERANGIIIKANELIAAGSWSSSGTVIFMYRINKTTGDTISTRRLSLTDGPWSKKGFLTLDPLQELPDGRFSFAGKLFGCSQYMYNGIDPLYQAGVAIVDSNFNFVKGHYIINNVESNMYNIRVSVHPDGSGLFSMLHWLSSYSADLYYVQFNDGVILKQRKRFVSGEGYPYEPTSFPIVNGGDMIVQMVGDSATNRSAIVTSKLHLSDTASDCMGQLSAITYTEPMQYGNPGYIYSDSIRRMLILERNIRQLTASSLSIPNPAPFCKQTSFCDTLQLAVSKDTTCPQTAITIISHKNRECGSPIQFSYDTSAVQSFTQLNDSTYQVIFSKAWRGYIKGSLAGCNLHTDSVSLTVLQAPSTLWLGNDADICPGNQLVLNAGQGFASYRWQNGSTDSLFTVTSPGTYYVTATNTCGGQLSDTIIILPHIPASFSAGSDVTICKNSSATLTAAPGFSNYQWSSTAVIANPAAAIITVSPPITTDYWVKAEQSTNCFVFDTVKVIVQVPPPVYLGADTSFCAGAHITLDAGPGFQRYRWNTGDTLQQLAVSIAGQYIVTATTITGCISTDSFNVLQVYPSPIPHLGNDADICPGNQLVLNAGQGFASYRWQNGSTDTVFTVTSPGSYYVITGNACGDLLSDTIIISAHIPAAFSLGLDISICKNNSTTLTAPAGFSNYLWGSTAAIANAAAIAVTVNPGLSTSYWVRAEENTNCFVFDTIKVIVKQFPDINLGADTSFCSGGQLLLNAGAGFQQYRWNTGDTAQQITAAMAGLYKVSALSANNCTATDSLRIVEIYTKPLPSLGSNPYICRGTPRLLDAGSYSRYQWSTGAGTQTIAVTDTGTYTLLVTDSHGCSNSSSLYLSSIVQPPVAFLAADTSICNYGNLILDASRSFAAYLWSTGETGASISVTQPGIYWLQATDLNHCTGTDSLLVQPRECLRGLYVPTAFSPDGNSYNDNFKPQLFGTVLLYQLEVYNRYGQLVFSTSNLSEKWDGSYKGAAQSSGTYTWLCRFRLAGQTEQLKRGTVVLLR